MKRSWIRYTQKDIHDPGSLDTLSEKFEHTLYREQKSQTHSLYAKTKQESAHLGKDALRYVKQQGTTHK
jgi:hypothetical protein